MKIKLVILTLVLFLVLSCTAKKQEEKKTSSVEQETAPQISTILLDPYGDEEEMKK